jgi:hypothetical protein
MNNVYLKSLRLRTGELLACGLDDNYTLNDLLNKKFITLHDPVVYGSFKFLDPKTDELIDTTSMSPFNGVTSDRDVVIVADQIVSICSLRDSAMQRYNRFVRQIDAYNLAGDMILNNQGLNEVVEIDEKAQELLNMPTLDILH